VPQRSGKIPRAVPSARSGDLASVHAEATAAFLLDVLLLFRSAGWPRQHLDNSGSEFKVTFGKASPASVLVTLVPSRGKRR